MRTWNRAAPRHVSLEDEQGGNVLIRSGESDAPKSKRRDRSSGSRMEKRVHVRIDPNDETITLKDIMQRIQEIQRQNPDLDVFFDGDEYAICSRPKKG
ncbi:MAG: hypothetical protein A3K68_04540 [Euryarchaeota archaeon RBG_16_68_13]|nr:MAG: hypothetical protein A3K68_04540 [Euryarchaeota archaeon RBG_16_68_13]